MKSIRFVVIVGACVALVHRPAFAPPQQGNPNPAGLGGGGGGDGGGGGGDADEDQSADGPGFAIVELVPGASIEDINADYGTQTERSISVHNLYLLTLPEGVSLNWLANALLDDPRVEDAELNEDCQAPEAVGGDTQPLFFYVPSSFYEEQYSIPLLGLATSCEGCGAGIVVAVLDTGVDAGHPLLLGRVLPGVDFVDRDGDPDDVGNGVDDDADGAVDSMTGHGTFVAGVVATVAPDSMILPVKVLDDEGDGDVFRVVEGIYYAVAVGADVINLGLTTKNHNHILRDALDFAYEAGVVLVAAAGNDDRKNPVPLPAGHEGVIAVAATDELDYKADFSNFGAYVSLCAPGAGIVSAMPGGEFASASGTSISAALVSASAALLLAGDPLLLPEEVRQHLEETAAGLNEDNPQYEGLLGAGRLDVEAAVAPAPVGEIGPFEELFGEFTEMGPVADVLKLIAF